MKSGVKDNYVEFKVADNFVNLGSDFMLDSYNFMPSIEITLNNFTPTQSEY